MVADLRAFLAVTIPTMFLIGMRHALEVDHITAIDNLVRLHNASKKARWVGTGFSCGHMISVLGEMLLIIYLVGSATGTKVGAFSFWGGVIGAIALATIGVINIYSLKKWGRTGSAILASKVLSRTHMMGPFGSALITGMVFGLGFDTATQISAITLGAIASAALGVQIAFVLAAFFAMGMIPIDTLDSIVLRSVFSRIVNTKGFKYMAYGLSFVALTVAFAEAYSVMTNSSVLPSWLGPSLAGSIVAGSFAYLFLNRKKVLRIEQHQTTSDLDIPDETTGK
jgi:nickel/cobalt transporter (NiCoT) family protein